MNNMQKQCLLACLGYYPTDRIDGKWGEMSVDATIRFQDDYDMIKDGVFGKATTSKIIDVISSGDKPKKAGDETAINFWSGIRYFDRGEFECKCGGKYCNGFPAEPDEKMVQYADEIRRRLGVPLRVNSGLRCKVWNQKNNGATASKHMTGFACDLGAPKGITPEKMATVAEEVIGNTGGIGIYSWGIHIDSRSIKARWNG